MRVIETKKYNGFNTEFFITLKVEKFLKKKDVNPEPLKWKHKNDKENYSLFYEAILFDLLDPNLDKTWTPEKEQRKNFKVVYYGIVEKIDKDLKEKGFVEEFEYNKNNILTDSSMTININPPFAVKYKILIK